MQDSAIDRRRLLLGVGAAAALAAPKASLGTARRHEEPIAFRARSSDGLTLVGDVVGPADGPEILFVHGLRQSRLSWDRQFGDPALAGFRLARFDLRGHGDSDKPEEPSRYADLDVWADDVAAVIDASGLRRPVIVGWSLGGFVTGGFLRRHGDARVAGVNLVDAVTALSPDYLTPLSASFAQATGSHDLARRTAATADFLLACFHRPPTGVDLQRMLVVNGMTARAVGEGFGAGGQPDLLPVLARSRRPLLLSHGAHDRLVRIAMAERVRRLRGDAVLSVYGDSGHSPFWEEAARFNRELAAFVESARRRS